MILITGAAGFIGSAYVWHLNHLGISDIICCDVDKDDSKSDNLKPLKYEKYVARDELENFIKSEGNSISHVVHMGACSDTMEQDVDFLLRNNTEFSKMLWHFCLKQDITYVYASSAATYGDGSAGYDDRETDIERFQPLNKYGQSKHLFDLFALAEKKQPCFAGLKFFNVFGPNEYHKGRMASVVWHSYKQIAENGSVKLFRSLHPDYADGEQRRDFIYVKDAIRMMDFFRTASFDSGIYNIATGNAGTFIDLVTPVFEALNIPVNIDFIDMPETIRDRYQYFTRGDISKLREAGYNDNIYTLSDAVNDYVTKYLHTDDPYLR